MKKLPSVSIIITTKNEEKNIRDCLESIKRQNYPYGKIEIIVVDNNSIDKTKEIAMKYTDKVFNKGPERSAQRNFGMLNIAKGKYVMFLDADMTIDKGLIDECVRIFIQNKDFIALYIPEIILGEKFFSRVRNFERSFYNGTAIDGLRIFRKEFFAKIKGFDEKLYACEDWDLTQRIKQKGHVGIAIKSLYHNEAEFSLKKYLKKKSYYSKNFSIYLNKWRNSSCDNVKKQFSFYYRFFGVFFENGKWRKLIKHPILALGVYWLRFLVGVSFIKRKI